MKIRKEGSIRKIIFHKTVEELRELNKENDIKLLELLKYIRKRKAKNDTISKQKISNNLC